MNRVLKQFKLNLQITEITDDLQVKKLGDGNGNKEENITQQVSDDPKQEQLKPTDDDLKQKQLETDNPEQNHLEAEKENDDRVDLSKKNDTGTSEMVHFRTGPDDLVPPVSGAYQIS